MNALDLLSKMYGGPIEERLNLAITLYHDLGDDLLSDKKLAEQYLLEKIILTTITQRFLGKI